MNSYDALKLGMDMATHVGMAYLEDLTDEQLMQRPHADCNHINWQVGHLVVSEHQMMEAIAPGSMPSLPDGMAEQYTKETASSDNPSDFSTKEQLLSVFQAQRAATLAALEKASEDDLSQASPEEMQGYAPTHGSVYSMQGSHWLMHCGQWVIVRRQLGKKALF